MEASQEEQELIERAQQGDQDAFATLMRPLMTPAYRLAYASLGERTAAEDAVQDSILIAWRRLHNLRPGAPLRPWLFTVVARRSRKLRIWHRRQFDQTEPDPAAGAGDSSQLEAIDLWRAVTRLSPRLRQLVVLRYYLDLSLSDAAVAAGIPVGTAKSRLNRAMAKLRLELDDDDSE